MVFVVLFQLSFMHVDMDRWSRGHLLACGWPDFRHTHTYSWRNFPVVLSHNTTFTFAATFSPDGATVQHTCHNMYMYMYMYMHMLYMSHNLAHNTHTFCCTLSTVDRLYLHITPQSYRPIHCPSYLVFTQERPRCLDTATFARLSPFRDHTSTAKFGKTFLPRTYINK